MFVQVKIVGHMGVFEAFKSQRLSETCISVCKKTGNLSV